MSNQCTCDRCKFAERNNGVSLPAVLPGLSSGDRHIINVVRSPDPSLTPTLPLQHDINVENYVPVRVVQSEPQPTVEVPQPVNVARKIEELRAEAAKKPVETPSPIDITVTKQPWQQAIFDDLRNGKSDKVNWLVADSIGKTNLAKFHCGDAIALRAPEHVWGYIASATNPTANPHTYKNNPVEGRAFVFDTNTADIDYELLLNIKDGFISSESAGPRQFTAPNVWVLSRCEPLARGLPQQGKIVQWTVVDGKLTQK